MSAFLTMQAALVAALSARPELAALPIYKNRTRALAREEQAAILVRLDSTRDDFGPLGVTDWVTSFEVEIVARGVTGADPAEAVDPLLPALWAAVREINVPGVIEIAADPQIDWTFDAGDTPLASVLLRVNLRHRTERDTLTPKD